MALPILQKVKSTEPFEGTPRIRSALQVKRYSECRSGTETPVSTDKVVGTPVKVENGIKRLSGNKPESSLKKKRATQQSNKSSQFPVREVVREEISGD